MRISSLALSASLGLSLVSACRSSGDDSGTTDAPHNGDANNNDGGGSGVTIQQVQGSGIASGASVSLSGVIVTAIDTNSSQKGNFWVEEPGGGPFSGVLVHNAALTDVQALAVGDILTITGGIKDEFALSSDTSGNFDTEIEPASGGALVLTKTGTTTVPTATAVDALMFGQAASEAACNAAPTTCATNVDWRMYEGVLIAVTTTGGGGVIAGGTSGSGSTAHFNLTGQIDVESTLVDFPTPANPSGTCLASVTGVLDYFFQYNLLPVTTADIATGGTNCPAREEAAGTAIGTCGDGIDNDGNGFIDCADLGCEVGSNAWLDPTNCDHATNSTCGCSSNLASAGIASINSGTTTPLTPVILNNVIVTGVSNNGFWIADAAGAASNGGIFVFTSTAPTFTIGQKLSTLQGIPEAFNPSKIKSTATPPPTTILELDDTTAGSATAGGVPTALATTATAASNLSTGANLAGSLVKLTNVKVSAAGSFNQLTLVDNTNATITMDDTAFFGYGGGSGSADIPPVGRCFSSLTGLMDLTTSDSAGSDEVRTINPRSAADMIVDATGTLCTGS